MTMITISPMAIPVSRRGSMAWSPFPCDACLKALPSPAFDDFVEFMDQGGGTIK